MTIRTSRQLLLSALIAGACTVASAQTSPPPPPASAPVAGEKAARPAPGDRRAGRMDPAEMEKRMAERHAQRQADLKAALKITAAQETAWATYSAAMQPPKLDDKQRPSRADMDKLTTPQRIDLMEQMQQQRAADMKKRGDAIKAFYAQLTPYQQGVFDQRAMRGFGGGGEHRGPGQKGKGKGGRDHRHGGDHGPRGGPGPDRDQGPASR
ncbi:Spy/CpxP family protein refolding chaperone [Ottowia sp.]|uniref:Spy/CpxP family protein refolding chaperone n=1 Tax=Ottowia sp. TaxID=1898956 RepID=UPI003A8A1B9C